MQSQNKNEKINHYIVVDDSSNTCVYIHALDKQTHTQIIAHRLVSPEKS